MQKKSYIKRKILIMQIIFIMVLSMILNITINVGKVEAINQTKGYGVEAFPASYRDALNQLQHDHSNWNFIAYKTDLTWTEFINGESGNKNSIKTDDEALMDPSHTLIDRGGYYAASKAAIEYYADPRNFLNEQGIFQFLEMTYNSSVQTKSGVQNILRETFMEGNVNTSGVSQKTEVAAKKEEDYIYVTQGKKNSEIAAALGVSNYEVLDTKNNKVSNETCGTGYTFKDKTNSSVGASYTIVVLGDIDGDGKVKSTDFAKIRAYMLSETTMTDLQKKAGDIDGDGDVKSTDFARVRSHILKEISITVTETKNVTSANMSYADIIMEAAEESGISPYSIAIKIIQEVGSKGSDSVTGRKPGYEGYYNFFNWGANDDPNGSAIANGLEYAKGRGWNSQYKAIVEGARQMADSYVGVGQNTAYFYKFNVISNGKHELYTHQYMSNLQDPLSQSKQLMNTYIANNIFNESLSFIIPVFKDMPSSCNYPSTITTSASNSYRVNGTNIKLRSSASVGASIITELNYGEIVKVLELDAGTANGYEWAEIERSNGTTGYMAKGDDEGPWLIKT